MEIPAASLAQVRMAREGHLVEIEPALSQVAKDLHDLDPEFKLRWSERGNCFIVYQERRRAVDGKILGKHVVTTWNCAEGPCDSGLVERVRKIMDPRYDAALEAEKLDAQARRDQEHRFAEEVGEMADKLHHGLLKDLGYDKRRIFVPGRD